MTVTRFAPSPTGRLHLGHARSAILAHDRARADGGRFLLRIEDIDGTRSRAEFIAGIEEDLRWLDLTWDGPAVRQSTRLDAYAHALGQLRDMGLLYPCFCTRAEIAASLAAPHGGPEGVYPGTCRALSAAEAGARMAKPHCWRLDMGKAVARTGALDWLDEIAGSVRANPLAHGDVVLARKDAPASYHLAVTIDDAWQGVSHIVRGADLFAATDVHRLLQALLALPTPIYNHHALLTDSDGKRLAKREGAPSLAALRESGQVGPELAATLRAGRLPIGIAAARA
ncbi:tRNA glutamyl-Q(34) synthetase GluQRS [Sphingomonas sp. GC_Shp_3]|uniref:tRNA glutamyl-Q(34) synthetase GluQRS n=1 Tax=Sphingomonas sp. GC_Shp_3 TaxID=2937383 RepID=UPI00226A5F12|nr:tRNA glutamyl-Q(34) synthetase GluQRS [Sphingomonas sp. GC_Shp_3]